MAIKNLKVRVSELKTISIQFPGDVYILALWVLVNNIDYSKKNSCTRRTTIHGLSGQLASLTDISQESIESQFVAAGFFPGATIEPDDNKHPHDLFQLIIEDDNTNLQKS
jgi:hypothetical protein